MHSKITLSNLPIGGVRVYLKMFGWSDLEGTLDAVIEHNFETAGAHDVSGTLSLSAVSVKVPELEGPAIQFDKLSVVLDKIDVVKQHAAVADVELTKLRLVVDREPSADACSGAREVRRAGARASARRRQIRRPTPSPGPGASRARESKPRSSTSCPRVRRSRSASTRRSRSSRARRRARRRYGCR